MKSFIDLMHFGNKDVFLTSAAPACDDIFLKYLTTFMIYNAQCEGQTELAENETRFDKYKRSAGRLTYWLIRMCWY